METLQALGSAMGLGLLAGIRLYATVFSLGLAVRLGWFHLSPAMSEFHVIASTPVLAASGTACLLEFFADKVPWIDSFWDSIHTFIRPIGAVLLGATALGSFDPTLRVLLALLCGGVALTGHASKAATRLVVNHSPEPFTNFGLSLAEDLIVPAGIWLTVQHPVVALGFAVVFLAIFAWLSPKIFRLLNVSRVALHSLIQRWTGSRSRHELVLPATAALTENIRNVLRDVGAERLPGEFAEKVSEESGLHGAVRIGPLKNSVGYLCLKPDGFVFVARRMFRLRTNWVRFEDLQKVQYRRGMFLDRLELQAGQQEWLFDLFKGPRPLPEGQPSLVQETSR